MQRTQQLIYFSSGDRGIDVSIRDESTGAISIPVPAQVLYPSFFAALHPVLPVLYSVDIGAGLVISFKISGNGFLELLNKTSSGGSAPCHIIADPRGRYVLVSNYNGGVTLLPLDADGELVASPSIFEAEGRGANPDRQERSHPHGADLSQRGDFAYVADLGMDCVHGLRIVENPLSLSVAPEAAGAVATGAGPRHAVIHSSGELLAVVNELNNTITHFARETATGKLSPIDTIATLPDDFKGASATAEIAYHPRASIVYASNRGHDSVVIVPFDPISGKWATPHWFKCEGKPQHFAFDSSGEALFVANSDLNAVTVHCVEKGMVSNKMAHLLISKPMCTVMT